MAKRQPDGSFLMKDGRVIYANSLILAADLLEIIPLLLPAPIWPFVSGGGGGGGGGSGNGVVGRDGAQGTQGFQGPVSAFGGPQGNQGFQGGGGTGAQGAQGFQGLTGSGAQGNQGVAGPQGSQGAQGFQGLIGAGVQGPQGNVGLQGSQGSQGNQGFQGSGGAGVQGPQGSQGSQGVIGTQGSQGFQGTGVQGPQGFQGTQGAQGWQGNQGPSEAGVQGPQGFQGSGGAGAGPWMETAGVVHLVTSTNEVNVGGTAAIAKLGVTGDDAGQPTIVARQAGGQSANAFENQDSAGSLIQRITNAGFYDIFATAGESNPTTSLRSAALLFGAGTSNPLDVRLARVAANQLTVTDAANTVTGDFVPRVDNEGNVGTSLLRWSAMSSLVFRVFGAAGDSNPTVAMQAGALFMGAGTSNPLDVRLARVAANQLTVTDAAGSVTGDFVPRVDNEGNVGTSSLRWSAMSSLVFRVFAAAGDSNPTVAIQAGALFMGLGSSNPLDVRLGRVAASQLTVTDASGTATGDFVPLTDGTGNVGTSSLRWSAMSSLVFRVFAAAGDSNPTVAIQAGALFMGLGSSNPLDVRLGRVAASQLTVTDASGTATGDFVPLTDGTGNVGTSLLRWSAMSSVVFRQFATAGEANPVIAMQTGALFMGAGTSNPLDVRLARVAANQLTVTDAAGSVTGDFVPRVDNEGNVGTSLLRWSAMSSVVFRQFATAGEANPVIAMQTGALFMGAGTSNPLDVRLARVAANQLTVTDAAGSVTGDFVPRVDNEGNVGTSLLRWSAMSSVVFRQFATAGEANPVIAMQTGALFMGAGTSNPLDVRLGRVAANQLTVTDAANSVTGDFVPRVDNEGNVGTAALRWSLVRAVTITSGDLNLEDPDKGTAWTIREAKMDGEDNGAIYAIDRVTGKKYRLLMNEVQA